MRRPLPMRVFALFMAVVMVISVITVTNPRSVVKADPEGDTPSATVVEVDDNYVRGVVGELSELTTPLTKTVNVPYVSGGAYVNFDLPDYPIVDYGMGDGESLTTVYQYTKVSDGTTVYSLSEITEDGYTPLGEGSIKLLRRSTYKWLVGTTDENLQAVDSSNSVVSVNENKIAVLQIQISYGNYPAEGEGFEEKLVTETSDAVTISFNTMSLSDFTVDNSAGSVSVTDADSTHSYSITPSSADELYYGEISYSVDPAIGETTTYSTSTDLAAGLGSGVQGTTYTITKSVKSGTTTLATSANKNLVLHTKNIVETEASAEVATIDKDSTNQNNIVITNADPTKTITVSMSSLVDMAGTGITVTSSATDVITPTIGSGKDGHSFTIPAQTAEFNRNGKNIVYTVTLTNDGISESFTVNVTYLTGTTAISSVTMGTDADSKTIAKDDTTVVNKISDIVVTTTQENESLRGMAFTKNAGDPISATINGSIGSVSTGITEEGTYNCSINAQGSFGGTGIYNFALLYDATAPTILGNVSLAQNIGEGYNDNSSSVEPVIDSSVTLPKKISSKAPATLSFTVTDGDDATKCSGIKSVTVNGSEPHSFDTSTGACTYTIPVDSTTENFVIEVTDEAGNSSKYTVVASYWNDDITISRNIVSADATPVNLIVDQSTNFVKWKYSDPSPTDDSDNSYSKDGAVNFNIVYVVTVNDDVAIKKVSLLVGSDDKTDSLNSSQSGSVYTYTFPVTGTISQKIDSITFSVTNENNYTPEANTLGVVKIDAEKPEQVSIESGSAEFTVDTVWRSDLVLVITGADADATDLDSGISGFTDIVGLVDGSKNAITSQDGAILTAHVEESSDASGTTVSYTIIDNAGNEKEIEYTGILIDQTAPKVGLSVKVGDQEYATVEGVSSFTSIPTISCNPSDDKSGVNNATLKLQISNSVETTPVDVSSITSEYYNHPDDTIYTVTAIVSDNAGNTMLDEDGNLKPETKQFKIDNNSPKNNMIISGTAPKASIYKKSYLNLTDPDETKRIFGTNESYDYAAVYSSDVVITLSVSDSNFDSAVVKDNGTAISPDSPFTLDTNTGFYTTTLTLTTTNNKGNHKITIESTDTSGNTSSDDAEYGFLDFGIDADNPDVKFYLNGNEYSSDNSYVEKANVKLVVTDDFKDNADITLKITKPDGTITTINDESENSFIADGKYTVEYTVTDKGGHTVTKSGIGFTVDNTDPDITVKPDTEPTKGIKYYYNSDVSVKITITDKNFDSSNTSVTDSFENTTYDPSWSQSGDVWTSFITISKDQEGPHIITVVTTDKTGKNTKSRSSDEIRIDTTAPVLSTTLDDATYSVTSSDGEGYKYADGSAKVGVSVSDTNPDYSGMTADITRSIPSGGTTTEQKTGDAAYSFTVSDDGAYTVKFSYKDKAGNPASATIAFTIDNGKPVNNLHITSSAPAKASKYSNTYTNEVGRFTYENYSYGKYFNDSVTLDVSAFDYNIDSAYVTDNGEFVADLIVSGNYASNSITIKNEGTHEVKVISKDKSGNVSSDSGSQLITFTIDRTKPSLTTYLNGFEYSELNTYVGSDCSTKVSVRDTNEDEDDVSVSITKTPTGGSASTTTGVGKGDYLMQGDGTYAVTYTVTDRAGNTSTASFGVTIDKTAPVTNLYVTTANPSKVDTYSWGYSNVVNRFHDFSDQEEYTYGQYYNTDVTVDLGYYDYNIDYVTVTDNGQEISPTWVTSTPLGHATATITGDGYHDIVIYVKDLAGNESPDYGSEYKRVYFTIDTVRPTITASVNNAVDGGAMRYLNTNADVNVYVTDTNKDASDLYKTVRMTPPGSGVSITNEYINEGTESFTQEADYEITYVATDLAGNVSDSKVVQFRVDKTAPNLSISTVQGDSSNSESVSLSFNMVESFYSDMVLANVKIYRTVDGQARALEANIDLNPTSANFSYPYTFTTDATYEIEFTAEDKCGNKSETKYTFIKDGTAPLIVLSGVGNYDKTDGSVELSIVITESFYLSNSVKLSGTRTDIDGVAHDIDFEVFPSTSGVTSELKHLFEEDGIYDIEVTSTDKVGNTTTSTVHFTIDTTDPEIGDLSKYKDAKLKEFVWDIDENELVRDLTVCDVKIYIDGVEYDGTTVLSDGTHVLRVEATDELDHTSVEEVSFIIDTIAPNIIVTNVEEGDNLLEATDITVSVQIDEDTLDWVKLNGEEISVTENQAKFNVNSKGKYTITAGAYDDAGNGATMELNFTFGKKTNWLLIICCGGVLLILLLAIILLIAKRRRDNY